MRFAEFPRFSRPQKSDSLTARHTIPSNPKSMSHFLGFRADVCSMIFIGLHGRESWMANQLARKNNLTWHGGWKQTQRRFTLDLMCRIDSNVMDWKKFFYEGLRKGPITLNDSNLGRGPQIQGPAAFAKAGLKLSPPPLQSPAGIQPVVRQCPHSAPQTRRRVNTTVARGSARLGTARLTRTRRMTIEVSTPSPAGTPPKPPQSSSSSSKKLIKDQLALVDVKTADGGTRKEVRPLPSLSVPSSPFSMRGFQPARSMRLVTRRIRLARLTRARRAPERRVAAPAPLPSKSTRFALILAP